MAALAAAAAVISYTDGLFLVHLAGASGRVALLYPLLPDGLIVISTASAYDAAESGHARPGWATTGVLFGAVLTVAMNVAAGALHSRLDALVDGVVPVVFFVALEILIGLIRRGRGGHSQMPAPATFSQCGHTVATTGDEAVQVAAEHARMCLGEPLSQRALADRFGMSRARVAALVGGTPPEPPRAAHPPAALGAGVAGAGSDTRTAPATFNGSAASG